jgi:hypothetical protein
MSLNLDGCQPCSPPPPVVYQGADKTLDFFLTKQSNGQPLDITGVTEIEAIFLNTDGTFLELKLSLSEVTLVSAPGGHFQVQISAADSQLLALSPMPVPPSYLPCFSDVEVHLTIGGKISIVVLTGSIQVLARRYPTAP